MTQDPGTDPRTNAGNRASPLDFLSELQQRISALLKNTPVQDVEKNMRAILQQGFGKLDLVTREEFELQRQLLERLRGQVQSLEARIAELEHKNQL